jgi:hypothetical protein
MFRLFGLLLVGLLLSGCAEYVALELAVAAANSVGSPSSSKSSNSSSNKSSSIGDTTAKVGQSSTSTYALCNLATKLDASGNKVWDLSPNFAKTAKSLQNQGVDCGVNETSTTQIASSKTFVLDRTNPSFFTNMDNKYICMIAKNRNAWSKTHPNYVQEAKRRGLSCGVSEASTVQSASSVTKTKMANDYLSNQSDAVVCAKAGQLDRYWYTNIAAYAEAKKRNLKCGVSLRSDSWVIIEACSGNEWSSEPSQEIPILEAKSRGLTCPGVYDDTFIKILADSDICDLERDYNFFKGNKNANYTEFGKQAWVLKEKQRRGLTCGVSDTSTTQIASATTTQSNTPSSAEFTAAQKEAERLRQELAALKAEQEQQQQTISNDTKLPTITIASATTTGAQGIIRGRVGDNTGIAELRVDGQKIAVDSNGNFSATTYVPEGGTSVSIEAIDLAGLSSTMSVRVDRATTQTASISFDRLNPLKRKASINNDALALVIGVSEYKETNAKAIYADSDAKVFQDYAIEKLGVPRNRVKTLVNDGADEKDMLLATKRWLARAAKQGKTDVYIFFAGHGLASDDGSKMYLLPYDGAPELLDKTAILRDELFADISAANPRSVTVFLDTCYSGTTRGTDMLIASRPIAIRALEQSIPDNFTVMTAAAGDQTAKPLEEAKHGMFSYFLMKGMEGEADANNDNEITAGELHSYVQTNVIQQSSGSQTPELQGDADRVLVRFQ